MSANLLRRLNAWFLESAPEHYRGCGLHIDVEAALAAEQCEPMHPDEDGWSDWIHPLPGYRMQCCDCGLIHDMEFAIGETINKGGPFSDGEGEDGVVLFRARRSLGLAASEPATITQAEADTAVAAYRAAPPAHRASPAEQSVRPRDASMTHSQDGTPDAELSPGRPISKPSTGVKP